MPALRLLVNGDQFKVAISGNKIAEINDPELISQALRYVMVLVGVRAANLPNAHEKAILINHIVNHYGGHTAEEIRLAFEKAVSGELELKNEDITCYENFSVLYFSRIMNAYRAWAAVQYRQEIKDELPEPVILTDAQLDDIHRQDVEQFFQRCRAGRIPEKIPDYFKAILVKDGLMKQEENLVGFFVTRLNNGSENIYVKQ